MYGSPGPGSGLASKAIRIGPLAECRSSQTLSSSATPTVSDPDAERRSTEPEVDGTEISPEPELAARSAWCRARIRTSPEPDLAVTGQRASATVTSPDPVWIRAPRAGRAVEFADPLDADVSRSAADLGRGDVGRERDRGGARADGVAEVRGNSQSQMGRSGASGLLGQRDAQLIGLAADRDFLEVAVARHVERSLDGIGSGTRLDADRSGSEVVDVDRLHALVHEVREGHRTQPWTLPRGCRCSGCSGRG
jgi:hypothetical protein